MKKRLTVFYSWQSDTKADLNKTLIEQALEEALKRLRSDATLEIAFRDKTMELDKDTQGIPGSPPVTQTILKKIKECTAFVADMTYVGRSLAECKKETERLFANPNVLIEYGYALRCHGPERLIAIMNTAFGKSHADNLPFDLRHLRWPIFYEVADASVEQKEVEWENLVRRLLEQIQMVFASHTSGQESFTPFVPHVGTKDPSVFFNDVNDLIGESVFGTRPSFVIPDEGRAFMRLYPTTAAPALRTELEAKNLASAGGLRPMGEVSGWNHARNTQGAIVYEGPSDGKLYNLTQLFLSREIWGLDAFAVNATLCRSFTKGKSEGFIASSFVEKLFVQTLHNYIQFARDHLKLPLPLRVEAGLVGVKDYRIALRQGMHGTVLTNLLQWQGEIASYDISAHEVLHTFFDYMWAKCGVTRSEVRQAELIREIQYR